MMRGTVAEPIFTRDKSSYREQKPDLKLAGNATHRAFLPNISSTPVTAWLPYLGGR